MHRTYEAIYEDDRLEWLDERPDAHRHRVLVTVLEEAHPLKKKSVRSSEQVRRVLEETRGAWGSKTADEIDGELEAMRRWDWSRPWYPSEGA